jgi:hypothetical protein
MNDSTTNKIMTLEPHQQRVIDEKEQLDTKIAALGVFLLGELFPTLDVAEQTRLARQIVIMQDYSGVLGERIVAFNKVEVPFDRAANHPIKPSEDLIKKTVLEAIDKFPCDDEGQDKYMATYFAQWGADQELDACCEWVGNEIGECDPAYDPSCLHDARRPKSLNQQALDMLASPQANGIDVVNDLEIGALR